jgi:hypothetical protein
MALTRKVGSDFAFQLRFRNDLPAIPFDPQLLNYPHPYDRLYKDRKYTLLQTATSLIHPDGSQGLPCSPFELGFLRREIKGSVKPSSQKHLLSDKELLLLKDPVAQQDYKLASVPWLMRTEYISTQRHVYGGVKSEQKIGKNILNNEKINKLLDLDKNSQIQQIEKSFQQAIQCKVDTLFHPTKKGMKAKELFPVFPDFDNWSNPYLMCSYDEDPLKKSTQDHLLKLEESVLKPFVDANGQDFFSLYVPNKESIEKIKLKRSREDEDYEEYFENDFQRDFDSKIIDCNYPFFLELRKDEGGAFYHPINKNIKLTKRRALVLVFN